MRSVDALYEAHKIAFSPFVFQTAYTMLETGILQTIFDKREGMTVEEVSKETGVSEYGVRVLTEMAEAADILNKNDDRYTLSHIGYFLLRDEMTRINLYFTQDVNYLGLFNLKESILNGKPEGLKVFGEWKTIYEGLTQLPEHVKKSWFEFDHFYSDNSFDDALKIIFKDSPAQIFDIGGNTGKWAVASTKYNSDVKVKMFDLPPQLKVAESNISNIPEIKDRVEYQPIDLLDPASEIPGGTDVYWMSQFLDCFGEDEIEQIMLKIRKNISPEARVYIMETFIDNQRFPAATYSLVATSLYFTAMANGNSKMYSSSTMKYIVEKAGFKCIDEHNLHQDSFHTILELKPV